MQQLQQELITNALALTGLEIDSMKEWKFDNNGVEYDEISIEKFAYYLLSPSFIEKYQGKILPAKNGPYSINASLYRQYACEGIGKAIYEYQKGNEKLLVDLLSKI